MIDRKRASFAALGISAVALVGTLMHEGYSDRAIIPVQGDVPTVGFGSTFREDGSRVQLGDTITPQRAVARTLAHIQKDEAGLKACVTGEVTQVEYDLLVDFAYQYGVQMACKSGMVRGINSGDYEASCRAYGLYKYAGGFDCSTPGNRRCPGVWTRSLERMNKCLEQL